MAEMFSTLKLSRQHFEFIADKIAPLLEFPTGIEAMADKLEDTNPRFDREKFTQRALKNWEAKHIPAVMIEELDALIAEVTTNA